MTREESILNLLADLYAQLQQATARIQELERQAAK